MKITKLESIFVKPRWHFLRVHTDEGIVGLGEPIVEGRARTVSMAIKEMEPYLIGQDPRQIEKHWQILYRGTFYRGGAVLTSALSGVEQALWDITGQWLGVPVYQLLGGAVRDRIRVYGHIGGSTIDENAASAKAMAARGFTALKTGFEGPVRHIDTLEFVDNCIEKIAAIRAAIPKSCDLAVDMHGRFNPAMSIRMAKALEPYNLLFMEEPVLPENVDALATVARATSIPIATGERLFTRWGYREVLEKQAAAVLQPDICHCGGILEAKKIAAMAEAYYVAVAPHNPLGPISLAAGLQVDACTPNFLCQEQVHLGEGYIKEPFVIKDGFIELPKKPGLGIELDMDALADKMDDGDWDTPHWFHKDDGSFGEW